MFRVSIIAFAAIVFSACAVDEFSDSDEHGSIVQELVSGPFTMTLPPTRFAPNAFGIPDTGPIDVVPGTLWLSASVAVKCDGAADQVVACARNGTPSPSTTAATVGCSLPTPCAGAMSITTPFTGFAADESHALSLFVYRTSATVTVNGATLNGYAFGD